MSQRPPTGSAPDPIGKASARLYAAGVERQQRLVTLRFLGILLEIADDDGHVHCDPDDLVGLGLLHGLDAEEVTRSRALLETFGVLDRQPTGWSIKHFAAPVGDAVPPAEVMAAIGRALGRPLDAPAPSPAPQADVVPLEPARARRANRWLAAPVGAAAAAAVVLAALLVSGQVRVPLTSRPASNSNQSAVGVGASATTTVPGAPQPSVGTSSPGSTPGAGTPASGVQAPTAAPAGTPSTAPAVCPLGNVAATVDHMNQAIDSSVPSSINVSLPPVVRTSVTGTVHNNSPNGVVVSPFAVTVQFSDGAGNSAQAVTVTALSAPTAVAAGASLPWSVTVQNPRHEPVPTAATAAQPAWHWDDATLAAACPH